MCSAQYACNWLSARLPRLRYCKHDRLVCDVDRGAINPILGMEILWGIFSLAFAAAMAVRGYNKKSLSYSGALAGFFVGFIHMYGGLQFGLTLTAFYLSSSKLTKFKAELKEVIEENYAKSSRRNAIQVLANSVTSTLLVILYLRDEKKEHKTLDALAAGILGHFACCCADTWSSEVGVVSNENPFLITSFKTVPKGTNGAISKLGTFAGALGGLFMGLVFWASRLVTGDKESKLGVGLITFGLVFGLLGTLLDSLLGGTLQYTGHSRKINRIVSKPGPDVTDLSGRDILSNEAVNFVSALLITGLATYWGSRGH